MVALLLQRGAVRIAPGLLPWIALVAWIAVTAVSLDGGKALVGFGQRWGNLMAVGVFMIYYLNARERLHPRHVISALTAVYLFVVVMGFAATVFPSFRLTTPIGLVLPGALTSNSLVYDLVFPRLAEIQQPWGAPEPFNRPSAPFPYANSWGVAFVVLLPVVVAQIALLRRTWAKVLLGCVVVASFYPALETSNRGLFIGIAVSVLYVALRLALLRRFAPLLAVIGIAALGISMLIGSGAVAEILERQEYSDSTGGRASIYAATIEAVLKSPLIGYGAPRLDESIGVSLGTQGYVWMLAFSYGLIGLALFCLFLWGAIARTSPVSTIAGLCLHSTLVAAAVIMIFYSFDVMQMTTIALAAAVLLRDRYEDGRTL
ncbi:O-antigen ligase family protein [Arthrobacter sp. MDB2-24]